MESRRIVSALSLLFMAACIPDTAGLSDTSEEPFKDIFINKWWEVVKGPPLSEFEDSCFMLHESYYKDANLILKFEYNEPWPHFSALYDWEATDEEYVYLIEKQYEGEVSQKGDKCWNIEHSIFNGVVCECSYDTTAVSWLQD